MTVFCKRFIYGIFNQVHSENTNTSNQTIPGYAIMLEKKLSGRCEPEKNLCSDLTMLVNLERKEANRQATKLFTEATLSFAPLAIQQIQG